MQVILLVTGTHQSGSWRDCLTRSGEKSLVTAGTPNTTFTFSFGCWRCTSCKKSSSRSMESETQQQSNQLDQCNNYTHVTRLSGNQIMRILWVPHAPLGFGRTRAEHLMEALAKRHEVSALSFNLQRGWESLRYLSDLLRYRPRQNPAGYEEIPLTRIPKAGWLNTLFLNRAIIREARRGRCEVVVLSPNPYLIGYVNFARVRRYTPIVCDYVDGGAWNGQ